MSAVDTLTIASLSLKGGVSKTTTAVNLALLAALGGLRTLVWDLDPQAAATWALGVDPTLPGGAVRLAGKHPKLRKATLDTAWPDLRVLPADTSLRHLDLDLAARGKPRRRLGSALEPLAADHDVVFVDCPPGLTLANESVVRAATVILTPIVPSPLSLRAFDQLLDWVHATPKVASVQVYGFVAMADRRRAAHRAAIDELPGSRPEILTTVVPASAAAEQAIGADTPIVLRSRTAVARAYRDLWHELQDRVIGKRNAAGR